MKFNEYYRKFLEEGISIKEYQIVQGYIILMNLSGKLNVKENINIEDTEYQLSYIELYNYINKRVNDWGFHDSKKDYVCLKLLYLIRELEGDNYEEN